MSFGDSLHQIEKNNSKIVSLEKIENLSILRGFSREYREYREVALITAFSTCFVELHVPRAHVAHARNLKIAAKVQHARGFDI